MKILPERMKDGSTKDVKVGSGDVVLETGDRAVFDWSGYTSGYFGRPFEAKGDWSVGRSSLSAAKNSYIFVSKHGVETETVTEYGLSKNIYPVKNCRGLKKTDMKHNTTTPEIKVVPETSQVTADGELLSCAPALNNLPLAQKYFMF
eukprot:scaffold15319_cov56-Attheya_sp.AAC.5